MIQIWDLNVKNQNLSTFFIYFFTITCSLCFIDTTNIQKKINEHQGIGYSYNNIGIINRVQVKK